MRVERQFRDAAKTLKDHPGKQLSGRHPYPVERDIIVLYGLWKGWTPGAMGRRCRLKSESVRKHILRLQSAPGDLFRMQLLSVVMVGSRRAFRCEFCGDTKLEKDITEEAVRIHVAGHVTSELFIQTLGVRGSGYHGM